MLMVMSIGAPTLSTPGWLLSGRFGELAGQTGLVGDASEGSLEVARECRRCGDHLELISSCGLLLCDFHADRQNWIVVDIGSRHGVVELDGLPGIPVAEAAHEVIVLFERLGRIEWFHGVLVAAVVFIHSSEAEKSGAALSVCNEAGGHVQFCRVSGDCLLNG